MILYFTGTGNSRYIAKIIAKETQNELVNLNQRIKTNNTKPIQTGRDVILVTPTYAWRIPRIVKEWILKTELIGAERIFFVMNCGSEIGNADKYNRKLCKEKAIKYMGTAQIVMPENYIAMFNVPDKEQAKKIVNNASASIMDAAEKIKAGQKLENTRKNVYDRFMSRVVNPAFYALCVKADSFCVSDKCIGCGKCEALCPLNNIRMENGRPIWGKACTHCMACICYCPAEAIDYGRKSIKKPRYCFEKLEIEK